MPEAPKEESESDQDYELQNRVQYWKKEGIHPGSIIADRQNIDNYAVVVHYCCTMKKAPLLIALCILLSLSILPASPKVVQEAEELLEQQRIEDAIELVEESLQYETSSRNKAELYALLSKFTLHKAARLNMDGGRKNTILALYSEGEKLADKAVQLDPTNHLAYFWRGSNAGMWGKLKGVFAALDRVEDMRNDFVRTVELEPGFSFAWFSLGQMYRMVPGGIISFGNDDYAVSLGRKAIDTMKLELKDGKIERLRYDYYVQLAISLHKRNWNKRKRQDEMNDKFMAYHGSSDIMEKAYNYEGSITIPELADRQEAEKILSDILTELRGTYPKTKFMEGYLEQVEKTYNDLF